MIRVERRKLFLIAVAVGLCAFAVGSPGCTANKGRPIPLNVHSMKIGTHEFAVEIAADPDRRGAGLMYRPSLETDRGMLFIFPAPQMQSFWMKNCEMDIDIAYIDDEGKIVNMHQPMKAPGKGSSTFTRYPSTKEVRYVLEMAAGWFKDHGVNAGDSVEGFKGPLNVRVR